MNNTQYIEKILASAERILVDTSTLMTRGFQQFIYNNKERFHSDNKKIIVSRAVYAELARHMESTDSEKSASAMAAIELMVLNKSIFQVDSISLDKAELAHAFADAQLLSELTLYKSNYNQLLITNDRKLSCDAFALNQQLSCKGRKIFVCYINWRGELQCCECARPSAENILEKTITVTKEDFHTHTISERYHGTSEDNKPSWEFDWKSGIMSISGIGILYSLYKGRKALIRYTNI